MLAAGGACSAAWVVHASVPLIWQQLEAFAWPLAVPAIALTLANVGLRFLRWQFLLRRAGVFLPIRQSAGIFVAGLAMLLTPAYAGEGIKMWLVGRVQPGTIGRTGVVVVMERLLDAVALALLAGAALLTTGGGPSGGWAAAPGLVLFGAGLAAAGAGAAALHQGFPHWGLTRTARLANVLVGVLLSLLAWLAGCLTLTVVCLGVGFPIAPSRAIATYGTATLLGGLTLLPAGVGVVGTAILVRLQAYGAPLAGAVLSVVLVRLFTVWLTAAIGIAGCWRLVAHNRDARFVLGRAETAGARPWGAIRRAPVRGMGSGTPAHFDGLAPRYAEQLAPAARERVVGRKVALMLDALRGAGIGRGARLLDAGCGHGWYVAALRRCGYEVVGADLAAAQVEAARAELASHGQVAPLVAGSTLALPFGSGAFDAAFGVNVLHHLGGAAEQDAALADLARVVRPGGVVLVHEINTVNPLFRLYMAYLFPLWKQIDLGTEAWLDPRRLPRAAGVARQATRFFTFLPDFTPAPLYRLLGPLESRLERSRWAPFSAHFTTIYRRLPAPTAPEPETTVWSDERRKQPCATVLRA